MHYYRAFNLVFASELAFEGLVGAEASAVDVHITVSDLSDCPLCFTQNRQWLVGDAGQVRIHIRDVAEFWVRDGNHIEVCVKEGADAMAVQLFLWGSAIGALLYQRGMLLIHSNAIVIDDQRCVIFAGPSKVGKSTLAYACCQQGFSILTDDVSAIHFDEAGVPWVVPAGLPLKLWQDVVEHHGHDTDALHNVANRIDKYQVSAPEVFATEPKRLCQAFILSVGDMATPVVTQLSGVDRYTALHENTYRLRFVQRMGIAERHFMDCMKLAQCIDVFTLQRPTSEDFGASLAQWVQQYFPTTHASKDSTLAPTLTV